MLVRADGDTAAEVADDEVHVLILLAELGGRLAADGLVVERVELAQAAELGKAGVVRDLRHLIDAHGVDEEGGDADHVADLSGEVGTEVGGVLTVGSGLHIVHDLVIDGIGAGGDGAVQAAAAADRVEIAQLEARLGDGIQNSLFAVVRLVDDLVELIQLLRGVIQTELEQLLILLKDRNFGRGCAGIDNQNLHRASPFFL